MTAREPLGLQRTCIYSILCFTITFYYAIIKNFFLCCYKILLKIKHGIKYKDLIWKFVKKYYFSLLLP